MRPLIAAAAALALIGCNEAPGAPTISIGPEAPTTTDTLVVSIDEAAVDPNNNDEVTYTYSWTVDGDPVDIDGPEVPAEMTSARQVWAVTVLASDDKLPGLSAVASVVVGNTAPTVTATITPATPLSTDDLTLEITPEDGDGDTVNVEVSWTKNGEDASLSSDRVPSDRTRPGDVWEATLVPRDARDTGEPFVTSVQIENQPPVMDRVILRPSSAYERTILTAVPSAIDADQDLLTYSFNWTVNGSKLGPGTADTLDGSMFARGDTISVEVIANDGLADSAPMTSIDVEVLNTPPTITSVEITPAEAFEDTVLACSPLGWTDDDADAEAYFYSWSVDGLEIGSAATIDGTLFNKNDRVACSITPFDGTDEGRVMTARPVVIQNTPPVGSTATVGPTDPASGTELTATYGPATDLDGDDLTYKIDWYVDGRKVASGANLSPGSYVKGDDIYALVTPNDGDEDGVGIKSNVVTAVNSTPRITGFVLSPLPLFSGDDALLTVTTADWDGDTVSVEYAWTINGTSYGSSSTTTIPSSETKNGDTVAVTVTTSDGTADGETRSTSEKVKLFIDPPEIVFDPEQPEDTDDLFCKITKESVDDDGGTITYNFSWDKDGTAYSGTLNTTDYADDTVPSSATADDEDWTCSVYASSPNGASTSVDAVVTVGGLQVFEYTDDPSSDDFDEKDLYDWMSGLTYDSGYYISFEIDSGTTSGGGWCAERADWYIDNYVDYASGSTTLTSGTWDRWAKSSTGSYVSVTSTRGYSNYFGSGCDGNAYSWCSEWGISGSGTGSKSLGFMPKQSATETYASGWIRSSDWDITIKVAPSRKLACDF